MFLAKHQVTNNKIWPTTYFMFIGQLGSKEFNKKITDENEHTENRFAHATKPSWCLVRHTADYLCTNKF